MVHRSRPVGLCAREGDQMCLGTAVQFLRLGVGGRAVIQRIIQPALHVALAGPLDRGHTRFQCVRNLLILPAGTVLCLVRLEQDAGMGQGASGCLSASDEFLEERRSVSDKMTWYRLRMADSVGGDTSTVIC
jgi:hypothetical protein